MSDIVFMLSGTEEREQRMRTIIKGVLALLESRGTVAVDLLIPVRVRESGIVGQTAIDWRSLTMTITDELLWSVDAVNALAGFLELRCRARIPTAGKEGK